MRFGQVHELIDELVDGDRRGEWVPASSLEIRWEGGNIFLVREPGGEARRVFGIGNVTACVTRGAVLTALVRPA